MSTVPGEQKVSLREFKLDLTENARINNPGSFKRLENLWSPQPGSVEQRPGGSLFCNEWVVGAKIDSCLWLDSPDSGNVIGVPVSDLPLREPHVNITAATDIECSDPTISLITEPIQAVAKKRLGDVVSGAVIYKVTF